MKNFFALTIAVLALSVFVQPVQAQQVAVPNVSGAEYADAVKTLQAAGFKTSMTMEKTATPGQNGKVSKQKPEAGQKADKSSVVVLTVYLYVKTVNVVVAPPVPMVQVPTVNTMPLDKARTIAKQAGYDLTVTIRETTNVSLQNCVIEQQTSVSKGSKSFAVVVGLLSSLPRAVPNFVGKHVDALGDLNGVKTTFAPPVTVANKADSNKVLSQSIQPGVKVKEGTVVTLTLGAWTPPPPERAVPDVMDMTVDQAKEALKKAGYEAVPTEGAVTAGAKDGRVIYQVSAVPSGVKKVPITIGVFAGSGKTVNGIPNTVGMEEKPAVEVLQKAGFTVVVSYEKPASSSYIGRVTSFTSNIPAGTKRVGITVGTTPPAPPPVMVVIPNFVGKKWISLGPLNGLTVDAKYERVQNEADGDKVLAQNPPAGAKVLSSTKIMLTLGNYVPPPPKKPVPKLLDLTQADAVKALKAAGFEQNSIIVKETAWQEWNGKVLGQDPAPDTVAELKYTIVRITVGKFTVTAMDARAIPMPDLNNYLLMIKGGTPPYDVKASFDVPKNVYVAGTKYCEIVPLKDNPPGWISYRVSPRADMTARFSITDSKGVKHQYDVTMKKNLK